MEPFILPYTMSLLLPFDVFFFALNLIYFGRKTFLIFEFVIPIGY